MTNRSEESRLFIIVWVVVAAAMVGATAALIAKPFGSGVETRIALFWIVSGGTCIGAMISDSVLEWLIGAATRIVFYALILNGILAVLFWR